MKIGSLEHVVAATLLLCCKRSPFSEAVSDGNNYPDFHPPDALASQYTFNQHVSIDPVEDSVNLSAETEALTFYSDDESEVSDSSSPSVVTSSLLYEGGSFVSTEAITCHGGGDMSFTTGSPLFDIETHALDSDHGYDESDDEDADDDDGHSSMLSNASLRRSRSLVYATPGANSEPNRHEQTEGTPYFGCSSSKSANRESWGCKSALSLRGGAATMGPEFAKRLLVAALVTFMYEAVCGHFLEFVKIVMQTSPHGTGYGDVVKTITSEKGVAGIWDGFVPWGVVQAVFKGGVFGLAHSIATSLLLPFVDRGDIPKQVALTLAGGIAGGFQGFVLSPTLLLKTRVMTNAVFREQMSLFRTTLLSFRIGADVVASEGLGALMKGAGVFATKRVFDWATRFYFSDVFESLIRRHKGGVALTATEKIVASLLGGTASTLATLPLDVLVAKTQDAKKAGVKVSAWKLFKNDLQEKGWGGLYDSYMRGFEARLLHVCFTTVVMKVGSPLLYDALFQKGSSS